MRLLWFVGSILLIWLILAQSCMSMRQPDEKAKKDFEKEGIELHTATITVDKRHIHFVMTGDDSLPTLFFVHGTPGSWDAFYQLPRG